MLTSAWHPTVYPDPLPDPGPSRLDRRAPSRIDGIEMRLRRLVDSSEPAVVFSSLVRLCVPAFCDSCTVEIIEGGRVAYRITYPQPVAGSTAAVPDPQHSIATAFEAGLPGWASYTGVMTSVWHARRSSTEDEARAATIVDQAIRMIRNERLADRTRPSLALRTDRGELRAQLRCR